MLSVGRVMEQSALTYATQPKSSEQISEKKTTTLAADSTDRFVRSGANFTPSYTKATVTDNRSGTANTSTDPDSNAFAREENHREHEKVGENTGGTQYESTPRTKTELMTEMVINSFRDQVNDVNKTASMKELEEILGNSDGRDDDYWSAEKTAVRIIEYARQLADGDVNIIPALDLAFEQGLSVSEEMFGFRGKLPSVCYETAGLVRASFVRGQS